MRDESARSRIQGDWTSLDPTLRHVPTLTVHREQLPATPGRVGGGCVPATYDESGKLIAYGRSTE